MKTLTASIVLLFALGLMTAQTPGYEPVANDLQLMQALIIPSSNALFEVGAHEPKSDKDWDAVRQNALILAESGNLLMARARSGDNGDWAKFSKLLKDAGVAAYKAASAKDLDKLNDEVGEQILNSCQVCHEKYLKK